MQHLNDHYTSIARELVVGQGSYSLYVHICVAPPMIVGYIRMVLTCLCDLKMMVPNS